MTDAPVQIDVQLRQLAQLFNSMDSAPFNERDLDADAEEFIVSSATEASTSHEIELVMHLMEPPVKSALAVEDAVRHFFRERARMKRLEFKKLLRQGRLSLPIGLMFLAACLTLGEVIGSFGDGRAVVIINEGLIIVGWVAMWRPIEIHLYEWWPLRDEWRVLERLARVSVKLVVAAP